VAAKNYIQQAHLASYVLCVHRSDSLDGLSVTFLMAGADMLVAVAIDVVADEPTCGAPDEDICGEVLLAEYAGDADSGGERVDPNLRPR
jgi:hypothetical protein